jgi:hypothetical protein
VRVQKGDEETGDDITLFTDVVDEQGKFNLNLLTHKDEARAGRAREVFLALLDLFRDARYDDMQENEYDLDPVEARRRPTPSGSSSAARSARARSRSPRRSCPTRTRRCARRSTRSRT